MVTICFFWVIVPYKVLYQANNNQPSTNTINPSSPNRRYLFFLFLPVMLSLNSRVERLIRQASLPLTFLLCGSSSSLSVISLSSIPLSLLWLSCNWESGISAAWGASLGWVGWCSEPPGVLDRLLLDGSFIEKAYIDSISENLTINDKNSNFF